MFFSHFPLKYLSQIFQVGSAVFADPMKAFDTQLFPWEGPWGSPETSTLYELNWYTAERARVYVTCEPAINIKAQVEPLTFLKYSGKYNAVVSRDIKILLLFSYLLEKKIFWWEFRRISTYNWIYNPRIFFLLPLTK